MQIDHLDYQWAKTQDSKDLGKMATEIHAGLHQAFQGDLSWTAEAIGTSLANPYHHFFIMRDPANLSVVGVAHFQLIFDDVELFNIAILPAYRRQGLSQHLLEEALTYFTKNEGKIVTLEVRSRNQAARQLYEKLAFKQIASRPNYYPVDLDDAIIYQRILENNN
ncbi:ribosomal protein S18-alanine N-acetyltransferase [Aerococcus viridans]|uniref:ribosomal protein S18-alanine N-acetyltransferase n=1 Tax=Aerococcus viridans TaxID=1377 RepID=UPI00031CFCB8|nr:ribosomal protein S18-alanine N-acetyltransferase [Aerococcus viridans]